MLVARALKNSQLTCGERHAYFGNRTLVSPRQIIPKYYSTSFDRGRFISFSWFAFFAGFFETLAR
jgi:hypothetical protein